MTLGLTKLHPALAGWIRLVAEPPATNAGEGAGLFGRDLVKGTAVSEVRRLRLGPASKFGVINSDQIEFWEGIEQRLVGDAVRIGRPVVILGFERLRFRRVEIVEIGLGEVGTAM